MQSKNNYVLVETLKPTTLLGKFKLWKIQKSLKPDQVLIESPKLEDLGFFEANEYLHLVDILKKNPEIEKLLIDIHKNKIPDRYITTSKNMEAILNLVLHDNVFQKIVFSRKYEILLTGAGSLFMERYISEFWEIEK